MSLRWATITAETKGGLALSSESLCRDCWLLLPYAGQHRPQKETKSGYRGLQPLAPQRRKRALILVMRPVNTAFMYTGERANPSVHSTLTSHLKGHLIHTNDLVNNRMKEKQGCGGWQRSKRDMLKKRMRSGHMSRLKLAHRVAFCPSWFQLLFYWQYAGLTQHAQSVYQTSWTSLMKLFIQSFWIHDHENATLCLWVTCD